MWTHTRTRAVFLQGCNNMDHLFILGWRRNYRSWRTGLLCSGDVNSREFVLFCVPGWYQQFVLFCVPSWYHQCWFKWPTPGILLENSPVQNPTNNMYVLFIMLCLHLQGKSENMEIKVTCSGQNVAQDTSEHSRLKITGFWYVTLPHCISLLLSLTHLNSFSRALLWVKS